MPLCRAVGSIPFDATEQQVHEIFVTAGPIKALRWASPVLATSGSTGELQPSQRAASARLVHAAGTENRGLDAVSVLGRGAFAG